MGELMMRRFFLLLALASASLGAWGRSLDVNLNNNAAAFALDVFPAGSTRFGEARVELGFLFTSDADYVGSAGLLVVGETGSGSPGLDAGIGVRVFGGTTDEDNDFVALTLSGLLDYSPPSLDRLKVGGYIDYSPEIVTFVDGEGFLRYGLRLGYEILQQAQVYVGYRKMELDAKGRGRHDDINSGGHVGVEFYF